MIMQQEFEWAGKWINGVNPSVFGDEECAVVSHLFRKRSRFISSIVMPAIFASAMASILNSRLLVPFALSNIPFPVGRVRATDLRILSS